MDTRDGEDMAPFDITPAVARLDRIHDALAGVAGAPSLPAALREATAGVAADVEQLAGELDRAGDAGELREIITGAREYLPRNFADFGAAIIDDLIREFRLRASAPVPAGIAGARSEPLVIPRRRPRRAPERMGGAA